MKENKIHKTVVLDGNINLGKGIYIGPFTVIEGNVDIGDNTFIDSHVVIKGNVKIGDGNRIYSGARIGFPPQDVKYQGEESYVEIGSGNIIREFVTIHKATGRDNKTIIGNRNFLMAYSHIAHNCVIGDEVIIVNGAQLGGHVEIEDGAFISSYVLVHQFVRIGKFCIIGGGTNVKMDVVPYALCYGEPDARIRGINTVGLKRRGFKGERIDNIKRAFRILFFEGLNTTQALKKLEEVFSDNGDIVHLIDFIKKSKRGITK
jgi:UDP-N-acetylglucosamine acyltransferase